MRSSVDLPRWDGWLAAYCPFNQDLSGCLPRLYARFSLDGGGGACFRLGTYDPV